MLSAKSVSTKSMYKEPVTPEQVTLRSQVTFTYVFKGKQRTYRFPPLGELLVDLEDKDALLEIKSLGGGCCPGGAPGGQPYFMEVPCH
jgi:hypothetical protein